MKRIINFRISDELKPRLEALAKLDEMTITQWLTQMILKEARKKGL